MTETTDSRPGEMGCERCRAPYLELLAASYNDADRQPLHQLLVDSCVAQHPGGGDPRSVRRLSICLMTLCMVVESDADPRLGPRLHRRMVAYGGFRPLEPQPSAKSLHSRLSAADVVAAGDTREYGELLTAWGSEMWDAWSDHHARIREWIDRALN
ncbi:DUF5946 family protein [Streptomyces sp. NPDC088400]|uniref:DUF5946 family protein n=1 Tax=Streptomyces sp. NPDC088400 TaxID=3365861 RepID=UPI00381E8B8E